MHDAPALLLLHHRRDGLDGVHRSCEVHVDDLRPFLRGQPVEVLEGNRFVVGGVIDQDVEPAEAFHHIVDHAVDLRGLPQVALKRLGLDTVLAQFVRRYTGFVRALRVDDGNVCALRGERVADALP